ncbi:hypothetical protein [Sagittula sp. S175]|uniref:hypothetical protein n=1 Tax=Sagittula sp. S175 TaxID=3415129 RepID=UPI003C7BF95C
MVSSSKILTVSYGTFSCTAEGFDDPLAVVKETTHFFRSVVSNDRFFGAEPPQFDAEMANEMMRAHIAQTSTDHGTLTLGKATGAASSGALAAALAAGPTRARPAEPTSPETTPAVELPDDDTIEATAVLTEVAVDDVALDSAEVEIAVATQPVAAPIAPATQDIPHTVTPVAEEVPAPAPRPSNPESVAAKLDRIRAVVASNAAEAEADDTEETEDKRDAAKLAAAAAAVTAGATAAAAATPLPESLFRDDAEGDEVDDDALDALLGELRGDQDDQPDVSAATLDLPETTIATETVSDTELSDSIASLLGGEALYQDDAEDAEADEEPVIAAAASSTWETAEDGDDWEDDDSVEDIAAAYAEGDIAAEDMDAVADEDFEDDLLETEAAQDTMEDVAEDDTAEDDFDADAHDLPRAASALDNVFAEDEAHEDLSEADDTAQPTPAPLRARVVKVKRADFLRAVEQGQLEEIDDEDEDDFGTAAQASDVAPAAVPMADESTLSPEEEDELARELAAVKAELSGEFDAWTDEDEAQPAPVQAEAGDWDDEDEDEDDFVARARANGWGDESYYDDDEDDEDDDLLSAPAPLRLDNPVIPEAAETSRWPTDLDAIDSRAAGELGQPAHVDSDEDDEDEEDPLEAMIRDSARKTVKLASPARVMLTEREVEDDDTSRLMEQTDTEMDEPEGNRRRTAIAHLRAAVAATKADRLLGRKANAAEEQEPYREDLASVVRPRRPQAPADHRTERPSEPAPRPAPLKLVAEQRVAGDHAKAPSDLPRTVPVRPRRVSRVAEIAPREAEVTPIDGDGAGFVAYAEQVGATELPELLEAAAAYMAYVEGRDQFSRPQLMSTVRQAEATESSREDRLRSFGQLLREGKIKKTAGGRFTASDRISFKPDRAAG